MESLPALRRATGAARCLACGKCTAMCPLAMDGGFSARRIAGQEMEEEISGGDAVIGRCLTCGSCEVRCPQRVRFTEFVRGLREHLPRGERPAPPHGGVFQAAARTMAAEERPRDLRWLGDGLQVAEEGEVGLFIGCLPLFDLYFREELGLRLLEIARSAVRLLNRAGIRPVVIPEERCCGHDLLWGGDRDGFETLARANTHAFAERGVKRLISACAECCRTWKVDYPEAVPGPAPRVEHLSEFLDTAAAAGQIHFRDGGGAPVTFQDPCRLGRHLGVVDPPRRLLTSLPGYELREMDRSGRDAVCCGTSGFLHCNATSRRLQEERLREAAATGAAALVTACPKCLIHLTCAQADARRRGEDGSSLPITDLAVLAAGRLAADGAAEAIPAGPEGPATGGAR